jgi:hypothetical protein
MPLFTRTGATADGDFPGKRKNIFDRIWRWSLWLPLASLLRAPFGMLIFFKLREAEAHEKAPEVELPWHGIPEAELSDAQEHEAQRRLADEWRRDE